MGRVPGSLNVPDKWYGGPTGRGLACEGEDRSLRVRCQGGPSWVGVGAVPRVRELLQIAAWCPRRKLGSAWACVTHNGGSVTRWVTRAPGEPVALGAAVPIRGEAKLRWSQWLGEKASRAAGPQALEAGGDVRVPPDRA